MLDNICYQNGHLKPLAFLLLENDALSTEEKQHLLSHIDVCDDCMTMYLDSLAEDALLVLDERLETRILDAVNREQLAKRSTKVLVFQFTKLALAVCLTMVLFFGGATTIFSRDYKASQIQNDMQSTQQKEEQKKPQQKKEADFFGNIFNNLNAGFYDLANKINSGFRGSVQSK